MLTIKNESHLRLRPYPVIFSLLSIGQGKLEKLGSPLKTVSRTKGKWVCQTVQRAKDV